MHFGLYPVTTTTVTTHIIVTTHLLTLTNVELEAEVQAELAENPALEMVDGQRCHRCGAPVETPPCPQCVRELLAGTIINVDSGHRPQGKADRFGSDGIDPLLGVVQPVRLADHIMRQLQPMLEPSDVPIAAYLAESIGELGFLGVTVAQVAAALGVAQPVVERVLRQLQQVDPVGVGSRGPQECLLRQLEGLSPTVPKVSVLRPIALRLLSEFWDHFLHARWSGVPIAARQISAAVAFIRANLTPYPAMAAWEDELARRRGPAAPTVYTRPDMVIYIDAYGALAVEIFAISPRWLRLSPSFKQMIRGANGKGQESWAEMAERAELFIKCLRQRQGTLRRAVEALVIYQERAMREGDEHVRPLTRTQLAQMLDVHEATVSRAVNGKTAALPDGRIVPLSHFFEFGKSIKELIRQMIANEDLPLNDRAIEAQLRVMGRPIARRTVAKYRNMLGILPAHLRARQRECLSA
jgi:RNA polymerase sigma-54 factor